MLTNVDGVVDMCLPASRSIISYVRNFVFVCLSLQSIVLERILNVETKMAAGSGATNAPARDLKRATSSENK
jgi:hypothetical protein